MERERRWLDDSKRNDFATDRLLRKETQPDVNMT